MEELIKRLERVIQTGVPDKNGQHPISAEVVLEVVKTQLSTNLAEVGTDCISRQAAIDATKKHYRAHDNDLLELIAFDIEQLPSVQPEWNNHKVACLLAELFDDTCACNYNGIDEWLPSKCELLDSCPHPVGVACWEQYLKHRTERRTDE